MRDGKGSRRISVIIPVYNKEAELSRCLDSVIAQSYEDLEILLVDDGSTDGSLRICEDYAGRDERIRLLRRENGGASAARNTGIEAATGAYIGFVDADDWIEPRMYEELLEVIDRGPACEYGLAAEGAQRAADAGQETAARHPRPEDSYVVAQLMSCDCDAEGREIKAALREDGEVEVKTPEAFFRELILHQGDSSCCTKLFRADFLREYRFTEGRQNEDFELLLRMLPGLTAGIPTLGEMGYHIYHSAESATRGSYRQKLYEDMMYNAFGAYRLARERYPEYLREAARFRLVQSLDFLLHIPIDRMTRDNAFYMRIVRFVRTERLQIRRNRYLTKRERMSLRLLAAAPRRVREAHRLWMRVRRA